MGCNLQMDVKARLLEGVTPEKFYAQAGEISGLIDHKYLNEDLAYFRDTRATLENIALFLHQAFSEVHGFTDLHLRLSEGDRLSVEVTPSHQVVLGGRTVIQCIHRHWNPDLSAQENKNLYGKCSGLHGHEYQVGVFVTAPLDATSGFVMPGEDLHHLLQQQIHARYHGQYLNDMVGNTSGEKIALQFYNEIKVGLLTHDLYRVAVRETRKNSFFIGALPF